jgi:hypothetical protein
VYQRDYILRLIEQMAGMIGTVAGLRKQMKQGQALELVDELLGRFYRLNSKLLDTLSDKDILAMLSVNGFVETEKVLMLTKLMQEEGELRDSMERTDEGYRRYLKALQLALAVSPEADGDSVDLCRERIAELTDKLKPYRLPAEVKSGLFVHFAKEGQYAKAEDQLFELLETDKEPVARERLLQEGIRFYRNLLNKDDAELEQGGLPRNEVKESLAQLLEKQ